MTCRGCGAEMPPSKNSGNPRVWCKESCRNDYKRALGEAYRATCGDCGADCGAESRGKVTRCRECEVRRRNESRAARRDAIAHHWNLGLTLIEIARLMDSSPGSVGVEMVSMRKDGWDLPHRYTMCDGKRVAA